MKAGTSGRHNFTYVTSFNRVDDQVAAFHRIVGFSHLAVLADPLALQVVRELQIKGGELQATTGATIVLLPTGNLTDALANLPPGTDAVYVAPLMRLSRDELRSLADQLAQRKLPTFSLLGRSEVEQGILARDFLRQPNEQSTWRAALCSTFNESSRAKMRPASRLDFPAKSASLSTCTPPSSSASPRTGTISPMQSSWPPKI